MANMTAKRTAMGIGVQDVRMATKTIHDDERCEACGAEPEQRRCDDCGVEALITDCGDLAQPRPLAADGHRTYCDACSERRADARYVVEGDVDGQPGPGYTAFATEGEAESIRQSLIALGEDWTEETTRVREVRR